MIASETNAIKYRLSALPSLLAVTRETSGAAAAPAAVASSAADAGGASAAATSAMGGMAGTVVMAGGGAAVLGALPTSGLESTDNCETLSDIDDDDIDQFILNSAESEVKASVWQQENKECVFSSFFFFTSSRFCARVSC